MAHFTNCSKPIKVSTQFSSPLFHHRDFGPKSFCGFPRVRSPLFCYQFLPSFETGTLEASIKPRLFKREKLAGNLFKSAAINYRHVRGLSRLPRCSYSYTDVFIIAAVAPALFSFPIRGGGFRDFGYQVVVEMAFAITASALVSLANVLMVGWIVALDCWINSIFVFYFYLINESLHFRIDRISMNVIAMGLI